jgi:hypothetical protein
MDENKDGSTKACPKAASLGSQLPSNRLAGVDRLSR